MHASWNGTDVSTVRSLRLLPTEIRAQLEARMSKNLIRLQAHIVADKLQGQVLHHRTGKLSASIRVIPPRFEGDSLVGAVEGAGGPAWYGRIHEFGGTFMRHTAMRFGASGRGRARSLLHRRMGTFATYPERSFMRSSFDDLRESMMTDLIAGINQAVAQGTPHV